MTEEKKKIRKKVGNILSEILLVLLALCMGVLLYSKLTGKQVFPYMVLWVVTSSMEDTIPERSYILSHVSDGSDVGEGDVITFRSKDPSLAGGYNTHRIKTVLDNGGGFVTQGDNCASPDYYTVGQEDVVAKYVCNLPIFTFFGRIYATKAGLSMTLLIIGTLLCVWMALFTKKLKEESRKSEEDAKQAAIDQLVAMEVARLREEANKTKKE